MRRSWFVAFGLMLWSITALSPDAMAAPKKPAAKPAPSKPHAQPKAKKSQPATSKKARATPAAPKKPPADIPSVTEASSVWQGCLASADLPLLAVRLGINEARLAPLLAEEDLFGSVSGECIPYVAVTGGEGGVASAIFQRMEPRSGSSPILTLRKTADGVTVTPGACDCPESTRRVLTVPARGTGDLSNEVIAGLLPQNVRWQLDILVPQMIARLGREQAPFTEAIQPVFTNPAAMGEDSYSVRVAVESHAGGGQEHLQSVEIIEPATGKRLDGVWWLERPEGPGVFIGMEGLTYERMIWQSPVKYVQKSRGVGPTVNIYKKRVAAPKGSKAPTVMRTLIARGYHLGVDMVAPKGVEVHAVEDATVAFAGRMGGYGNLIILDHGRGYQTYYAHLSRIDKGVKSGTKIGGGEVIGLVGSTGHSTAPHLHFETRKDMKYIDPFDETRQLGFWLLTADDQERLAMQLLAATPSAPRDAANGDSSSDSQ